MECSEPTELNSVFDFLTKLPPFEQLPQEQVHLIAKHLKISYHCQGESFENDNMGLRIIRSGAVELRNQDNALINRLDQGESFNITGLNIEHKNITAILIEDSLIYLLPQNIYQQIRNNNRFFDRHFHDQRSRRLRRAARYEVIPNNLMRKVGDTMTTSLLTVNATQSIKDVAKQMSERHLSSALIVTSTSYDLANTHSTNHDSSATLKTMVEPKELIGIITDRDFRSRVVASGHDIDAPISSIMTASPQSIAPNTTLFDATLFMVQTGFHHIPIEDNNQLVGILTASDLMLANENDPVFIVQHIARQADSAALSQLLKTVPNMLMHWVKSGIHISMISHVLTAISDAVTVRLIELAIKELGQAPVPFCWLAFGSQGRREQLLNPDQDNGLIIHNDFKKEDYPWFTTFAKKVCDGLNECGYVYCPGDIMAMNNTWCQPLSQWQQKINTWTQSPTPKAVMHTTIFFDLRSVYGDKNLLNQLQDHMLKTTSSNSIFIAALAKNALQTEPPIGIFRRFVVERNGDHADELDLKKRGILPIIDMVRLHALAKPVHEVGTVDRLNALVKHQVLSIEDSRNLEDALSVIMKIRMQHQVMQIKDNQPVNNYINPKTLPKITRRQLKDAFDIIKDAQNTIQNRYRAGLGD